MASVLQAEALLPVFAHILSFTKAEEQSCRAGLERLKQVGGCVHAQCALHMLYLSELARVFVRVCVMGVCVM